MAGLDVNASLGLHAIRNNIFVGPPGNRRKMPVFRGDKDSFALNNDLKNYLEPSLINRMVAMNPKIKAILEENGLPLKINFGELRNLKQTHLPQTMEILNGIYDNLDDKYRQAIDFDSVQKAAFLHDIGKVLIPEKYLEKPTTLSSKEFDIIKLHSELGYELLKTTDLSPKILYLIKYHHQNHQKTGYPSHSNFYVSDLNSQLLSVADTFSALLEKRPYKAAMSKNKALSLIHERMKNGEIHPYLFKALVDFVNCSNNKNGEILDLKPVNSFSP